MSTTELPEAETEESHQVKRKCLFVTTATSCVALLKLPRPRSFSIKCHSRLVGSRYITVYTQVTIFDQKYCSTC